MVNLCICGGGAGAHVLAGIASSQPIVNETRVLTIYEDEPEIWSHFLETREFVIKIHGKTVEEPIKELKSKPNMVTRDASKAVTGCDIIVIVVPAFAHAAFLKVIKPYVKPGTVIVGMPGNSGFEFAVAAILGEVAKNCTVVSFPSLPWIARIQSYGEVAELLGFKENLQGAMQTGQFQTTTEANKDPVACMQAILGEFPKLSVKGHMLAVTLMAVNGYIHPPIMYGKWHDWDNQPFNDAPLFYHGMDEYSAKLVGSISDEVLQVANAIKRQRPSIDLSSVEHIHQFYLRLYPLNQFNNTSSLYKCMTTLKGYGGIVHPCIKAADGKLVPNFENRYMTECVPYGLLGIKGIAEIAGVKTPNMDKVLYWAQDILGKSFICNGKVNGKDIHESRAPQAFGINNIDSMLGLK